MAFELSISPPKQPSSLPNVPNAAVSGLHHPHYSNPPSLYQILSSGERPQNAAVSEGNIIAMGRSVPLGPFTGYASILKRSTFLKPAQHLLDDIFGPGFRVPHDPIVPEDLTRRDRDRVGYRTKDSRLVILLEEVYKRCKLYCQQIQAVTTSFESVAGLAKAAPFVTCAIKAISNHFGHLKTAIMNQLRFTGHEAGPSRDPVGPSVFQASGRGFEEYRIRNLSNLSHPVCRSQRGLPERAVSVLKKWLFEHFLHPYPTDSEKQMLAQQTGLSRTQISNWFINSRVRIWKPMVEEIHSLQTCKSQVLPETSKRSRIDFNNNNNNNNNIVYVGDFTSNSNSSENIGLGPSQAFFPRPITNNKAGFINWF